MPSLSSATVLDLSRLPAPSLVDQPSYEAIFASLVSDVQARLPSFNATVESDPAVKVLQVAAYREQLLRRSIQDAGEQVMIAYATGANLEQLAAYYGVSRVDGRPANPLTGAAAILESDEDLRSRTLLAIDAFSVAGPEAAYVFHTRTASFDVLDASATSPAPGEVLVTVQSRLGDGSASAALLATVAGVVNADGIRPLTDRVTVASAAIVPYAIDAQLWLYPGPDAATVQAQALDRANEYVALARRLGRNVARTAIIAALHVPGAVQRIELTQPAADRVLDRTQAPNCTAITITIAGYDY